jgi:hypothetical protein
MDRRVCKPVLPNWNNCWRAWRPRRRGGGRLAQRARAAAALAGSGALAGPCRGDIPAGAIYGGLRRYADLESICALPHRGDGRRTPALAQAGRRGCLDRWYQLLFLGN